MYILTGRLVGQGILFLCFLLLIPYLLYTPLFNHSGDTTLGLFFGVIAGLIVIQLMFLGIKKSFCIDRLGSQQQWISAHNYTGAGLLIVTLLHAGFQVDMNIHGAAIAFLFIMVASGLLGVIAYTFFPSLINKFKPWFYQDEMLNQLQLTDSKLLALSAKIDHQLNNLAWVMVQGNNYSVVVNPGWRAVTARLIKVICAPDVLLEIKRQNKQRSSANRNELDEFIELFESRVYGYRRLIIAASLALLMTGWRRLHRLISNLFFVLLIVHVVVSFQY